MTERATQGDGDAQIHLTSGRRALILATLWLIMLTISSQFLIISPVLPRIGEELSVPEGLLGTLVSGYALSLAFFALVAGPISDRIGRRATLRVGTALIAACLLLHGFAESFAGLLALRILTGAGSGIMSGAVVAYLGDTMPYAERGRAIGVVLSGGPAGMVVGVPLGTMLASASGFWVPFVMFGGLMVVASVGTFAVLVDTGAAKVKELSLGRALRAYLEILSRRELVAVVLASATLSLGMAAYVIYLPSWLEASASASPEQIALLFLLGGAANVVAVPLTGALSDRIGRKWIVVACSLGTALAMGVTALATTVVWATILFVLAWSLAGARYSPFQTWMTALVPDERRGSLMNLTLASGQGGFALGAAAAGWAFVEQGYLSDAILGGAAAMVTALVLAALVPEPSRSSP
jgi:predicted MFS family arabinose efflux permease